MCDVRSAWAECLHGEGDRDRRPYGRATLLATAGADGCRAGHTHHRSLQGGIHLAPTSGCAPVASFPGGFERIKAKPNNYAAISVKIEASAAEALWAAGLGPAFPSGSSADPLYERRRGVLRPVRASPERAEEQPTRGSHGSNRSPVVDAVSYNPHPIRRNLGIVARVPSCRVLRTAALSNVPTPWASSASQTSRTRTGARRIARTLRPTPEPGQAGAAAAPHRPRRVAVPGPAFSADRGRRETLRGQSRVRKCPV